MYYHIEGTVAELEPYIAVIDCGGVGYLLNVSLNTLSHLKVGERAKLFVSESIREDSFELYGFYGKSEKRCFEMLISVSGVGPKAALSILSSSTPEALAMAVINGDERGADRGAGDRKKDRPARYTRAEGQNRQGERSGRAAGFPCIRRGLRPGKRQSWPTLRRHSVCSATGRQR